MHVQPEPLVQQRFGDQPSVRDDHDGRRLELEAMLEALRLEDRNSEPRRNFGSGRRDELPATSRRRVGSGQYGADLTTSGEPLQDIRAERRGSCDRDAGAHRPRRGL